MEQEPLQTEITAKVDSPLPVSVEPNPSIDSQKKTRLLPFIILALVIAFSGLAFFLYRSSLRGRTTEPVITARPTPREMFLTVDNFKQVTTIDGELLVKGSTLPNTTVAIFSDVDDTILESDAQGNFQDTVVVGETGGLVRLTAYGRKGQEQTLTFNVLAQGKSVLGKSDSKVNNGKSETAKTKTETSSQKIEKAQGKPEEIVAFLNEKTEIKRVEKLGVDKILDLLSEEGTGGAELGNVKLKKMDVVEATAGAELKRHAVSGVITNITEGIISLSHQIQRERQSKVYFNSSTLISVKGVPSATGADLKIGMRIAAVGIPSGDGLLAARIHVIPGKAAGVFEKNPVPTPSSAITPTGSATPSASPTILPSPTATLSASPTLEPTVTPTISPEPTP